MSIMKKVFVTGSTGLIGTHIVNLLIEKGYTVIGFAKNFNFQSNTVLNHKKYKLINGDICDVEEIKEVVKFHNPEYVIHLAAQAIVNEALTSTYETFETNIRGTWNLLEACRELQNIEKIIIASSDKAYGSHSKQPYLETYQLNSIYPYDVSKKISEELAMSYHKTFGLPIIVTRCGNVYGPYDYNNTRIVPDIITSLLENNQIVLRGDGSQTRCYVFAEDVAKAYYKLLDCIAVGEAFNIGHQQSLSVLEVVQVIAEIMGKDYKEKIVLNSNNQYEILHQSLDCNKIKVHTGWEPEISFREGIFRTINWFKKERNYK
jgi:CDP-glucose 4,6-dehydratase